MNIFVLDIDPVVAAQSQCDKHVVKMPLECAQMLSTVHRCYTPDDDGLYRKTHVHHPCTVWAGQSTANYDWLYNHFGALSDEYRFRYGNTHLSWFKLRDRLRTAPAQIDNDDLTPFAQAMPDEYKCNDAVVAYRAFYQVEKASFLSYTKRQPPNWLTC